MHSGRLEAERREIEFPGKETEEKGLFSRLLDSPLFLCPKILRLQRVSQSAVRMDMTISRVGKEEYGTRVRKCLVGSAGCV